MGYPRPARPWRHTAIALAATAALFLTGLVSVTLSAASPAAAAEPASPANPPTTVSSDPLPTPQINGVVWDQVIVGNTVYVGGNFTSARPFGAAAGTSESARSYLLSYNLTTGALLPWTPVLNGQVRALAASPDGTRLYVGGDFTNVGGTGRNRIVAYNTATGAINNSFAANANNYITAVTATNSTVYLGGIFGQVTGVLRPFLAAVNASDGATTPWNPITTGGRPYGIVVSPGGDKVVIGGDFTSANGSDNPGYGMVAVDTILGASVPWAVNNIVRNAGTEAAIYSLASDNDSVYGSGYVFGSGGNLEGTFRASWADGTMNWVEDCHGDTYSVAPAGDIIYTTGHIHYCGNLDGKPQTDPWNFNRGLAFTKYSNGTLTADPYGYYNWNGQPKPDLLDWYPTINAGTFTGVAQGPWDVAANSQYVLLGGEFTTVNNRAQQGLVRYAIRTLAPNTDGPRLAGDPINPRLESPAPGVMRVSIPADWDRDDPTLTYKLYRDGRTATAIFQTDVTSRFWDLPTITFLDTGLDPGSTHSYRVQVIDKSPNATPNSAWSSTVSGTVATSGTFSDYARAVVNDHPTYYWRLGDPIGSATIHDTIGTDDGTAGTGVTFGQPGAIIGDPDTAARFSGNQTGDRSLAAQNTLIWRDNSFAVEGWFNTTSNAGGKILGFGSSRTGRSNNYDRHIYMNTAGKVIFGAYPNESRTVQSTKSYNDGQWHHVVGDLGPDGMSLYVDGIRVGRDTGTTWGQGYWGYWRIGGDNTWEAARYINGSIDEVAVYPAPLTTSQVQAHYTSSGRTLNIPTPPADAYGAAVFNDEPLLYWRFGEPSGSAAADSGSLGVPGSLFGSYTRGTAGVLDGVSNSSTQFGNGFVTSNSSFFNPLVYTEESWFNTTTTQGGKIMGFGASRTTLSSNYDRHVYMQDDGKLVYGVWTGVMNLITTPLSYNDGRWHHVAATQGPGGMKLYVDGALIGTNPQTSAESYTGYWRAGGDTTWGSTSPYFAGKIDEFAVYPVALSAASIANHYTLGAPPLPNVDPTADFTTSAVGKKVTFNTSTSNDSDGTIVGYAWDFGDGTVGTGPNPVHPYSATQSYTVTLTVTDDDGATDSISKVIPVDATPIAPTAAFTQVSSGLHVNFDATTSSDPDGSVSSYAWTFDGAGSQSGSTTSFDYGSGGDHYATLTVTDDDGVTNSVTIHFTLTAPNQLPTADFDSTMTVKHLAVDAGDSDDPDGSISSYSWNWGDGTPAGSNETATHDYTAPGDYTVTLTVTDNVGATATKTATVTAQNVAPVAVFTIPTISGQSVSVNGSGSSDSDGSITSYSWNWGDGTPNTTGASATPSHSYTTFGDHTITLTVTDNLGATNSVAHTATTVAPDPGALLAKDTFTRTGTGGWGTAETGGAWSVSSAANSSVGGASAALVHTAGALRRAMLNSVSAADVDITGQVASNKATTAGHIVAGLVARQVSTTDYYQARARLLPGGVVALQLTRGSTAVLLADTTIAGLSYAPGDVLNLRFQVQGTSPTTLRAKLWKVGTTEPAAWQLTVTDTTATLQNPGAVGFESYISGSATNAPVTITLDNYTASTIGAPPSNVAPVAVFTIPTISGQSVSVNGSGSSDSDGSITSYSWNWGDGTPNTTGASATPSHSYTTFGDHTITLTVTDNLGATNSVAHTATTVAPDPGALLAKDTFTRTGTGGWGTAETGGAWSVSSAANSSVGGASAALVHTAGALRRAMLNSVSAADVDITGQVASNKATTAGHIVAGLVARQVSTTDYYQARARLLPGGVVALQLTRGSTAVLLADTTIAGLSYAPGDVLNLRFQVQGTSPTTLRAKLWKVGTTEPAAWQLTVTDTTATLQNPGAVGFESYISGSATNAPVTITLDNYTAAPLG